MLHVIEDLCYMNLGYNRRPLVTEKKIARCGLYRQVTLACRSWLYSLVVEPVRLQVR